MPAGGQIRGPMVDNEIRVVTAAGSITMLNENVLVVNKTVGAATAVTLPTPPRGRRLWVVDGKGDAATNNITITPASGNINGAANFVISENYGAVQFTYNGTEWNVTANFAALSATELGFLNGVTAGTAAASKAVVLDANSSVATINSLTTTTENVTSLNVSGITKFTDIGSYNAAGSVIANAQAITNAVNLVAGADDTKGVVLPASVAGKIMLVYSSQATNGLKVYPPVNSAINGGSANAAITIEGKTLALFICTGTTDWSAIYTANA